MNSKMNAILNKNFSIREITKYLKIDVLLITSCFLLIAQIQHRIPHPMVLDIAFWTIIVGGAAEITTHFCKKAHSNHYINKITLILTTVLLIGLFITMIIYWCVSWNLPISISIILSLFIWFIFF